MIYKIDRIGTEEEHDGWFLINESVGIKFVVEENGQVRCDMKFDTDVITDREADALAQEYWDLSQQLELDRIEEAEKTLGIFTKSEGTK